MAQKKPGTAWADSFDKQEAEALPDLSLEKVTRNFVYKSILKESKSARENVGLPGGEPISDSVADNPKEADGNEKEVPDAKPIIKSNKPAMAKYSPLDPEILDLMYGKDEAQAEDEPKPDKKEDGTVKKTQLMKK